MSWCKGLMPFLLCFWLPASGAQGELVASPDKERAASWELYQDTSTVRIFQVNLISGGMSLEAMIEEDETAGAPTLTWLDSRTLRIAYKRQWPLAEVFDEVWIGKVEIMAGEQRGRWKFRKVEE